MSPNVLLLVFFTGISNIFLSYFRYVRTCVKNKLEAHTRDGHRGVVPRTSTEASGNLQAW